MSEEIKNELHDKVVRIQNGLHAPKDKTNEFGKFKYRKCEDILQAVKPLLLKENCVLSLSDELVLIGDRYYIKAVARVSTENQSIVCVGYARESEVKKGMDVSQITGAASSYARKFALAGLFCVDNNKDYDETNKGVDDEKDVETKPVESSESKDKDKEDDILEKVVSAGKIKFRSVEEFVEWRETKGFKGKLSEASQSDLATLYFNIGNYAPPS